MKQIFTVLIAVLALTTSAFADCNVFKSKNGNEVSFNEYLDPVVDGQKLVNGGTGTGIMQRIAFKEGSDEPITYFWATAKIFADDPPLTILIWDDEAYFPACEE